MDKKGNKTVNLCTHTQISSQQNKEEKLIKIAALIFVNDHVVITGIYNYLLLPFTFSTLINGCGSLPGGITEAFIPEGSGPLIVRLGLSCSFPLASVTGHDNTRRHSKRWNISIPGILFLTSTVEMYSNFP